MAFMKPGERRTLPRNEHVDIHLTLLTLNADAPSSRHVQAVEIREWIKGSESYGNGILLSVPAAKRLAKELPRLLKILDNP